MEFLVSLALQMGLITGIMGVVTSVLYKAQNKELGVPPCYFFSWFCMSSLMVIIHLYPFRWFRPVNDTVLIVFESVALISMSIVMYRALTSSEIAPENEV